MNYEREYNAFLMRQKEGRSGESLRRLQEGHGYLEQLFLQTVWWPAAGSLDHLFAEYEISNFTHGFRFLDFAYLRPPYRLCFELDGFGTHAKDLNRWQLLGKYYEASLVRPHLNQKERQLAQFFVHQGQQVTPAAAAAFLQISRLHTRRL